MAIEVSDLDRLENEATRFYYLWFAIYLVLGVGSIVCPGISAMGATFGLPEGGKYLAGVGALCAAVYGFLKPNDYAATFDAAIAEIRTTRHALDLLTPDAKLERMKRIYGMMSFKYQGHLPGTPVQDGPPGPGSATPGRRIASPKVGR